MKKKPLLTLRKPNDLNKSQRTQNVNLMKWDSEKRSKTTTKKKEKNNKYTKKRIRKEKNKAYCVCGMSADCRISTSAKPFEAFNNTHNQHLYAHNKPMHIHNVCCVWVLSFECDRACTVLVFVRALRECAYQSQNNIHFTLATIKNSRARCRTPNKYHAKQIVADVFVLWRMIRNGLRCYLLWNRI